MLAPVSWQHLLTETPSPDEAVIASVTDSGNMCIQRQLAVDDDAEVACCIDDCHHGRQQRHVSDDSDLLQLHVPSHMICVLVGFRRGRLAFIQSLMSATHAVRRTMVAAALLADTY